MKVAIDLRPLLEAVPGGVRTYATGLVAALEQKHNCYGWTSGLRALSHNSRSTIKTIWTRMPNVFMNPLLRFTRWPAVDELIARRAERPDWFIMPNPNFIALSKRTKLAVVFHDLSFEVNPSWFSPKERLWHQLVRPRELARRADRVIAVSEWTKRDLIELYGVEEGKITVVPPRVAPPPQSSPLKGEENNVFFYLGSISRRKNVLGLVHAFELLDVPNAKLVLAGPDGFGAEEVKRALSSSPARDRIRLLGAIAEDAKRQFFESATAFVYPSFYEGFGIPVAEAMSHGIPVIISNRAALPEVAGGAGLLVDPYDVSTIAMAMKSIADDRDLRERLRTASYRRAQELCASALTLDL